MSDAVSYAKPDTSYTPFRPIPDERFRETLKRPLSEFDIGQIKQHLSKIDNEVVVAVCQGKLKVFSRKPIPRWSIKKLVDQLSR